MSIPESGSRIRILPPLLAQKIAAGEVIDRPQSVVRELLDNAIDAGASEIELHLREGGTAAIIVQDNGGGMDRDDLALCWLSHATSKLHEEIDLQAIRTMGFRGEALSSIATVSRLAIYSATGSEGACLEVQGGTRIRLDSWAGRRGTRVEVRNLFYNLPARLQFLKRAGSEFLLCKTTFLEKALAHPAISFRLFNEDKLVLFLAGRQQPEALRLRFEEIHRSQLEAPNLLHQIAATHAEGAITLVLGRPELYQHDRKLMQVHVNRRRVNEYSLQQAVEAGYAGFLPGGRFPVAALFLELDPARVDVNIHPAKREVKLMDGRRLHSLVVRMIQDFLRIDCHRRAEPASSPAAETELEGFGTAVADRITGNRPAWTASPPPAPSSVAWRHAGQTAGNQAVSRDRADYDLGRTFHPGHELGEPIPPSLRTESNLEYLGQVFGVFLLVRRKDELLMVDFHAAHERILFDRFRSAARQQALLLPIRLEADDPQGLEERLAACQASLRQRGIGLVRDEAGWLLEAIPDCFSGSADLLVQALESETLSLDGLDRNLFATLACRSARKDGDVLAPDEARALLEAALALPEPRCPHGRPVWFSLTKDELFELVGRKV